MHCEELKMKRFLLVVLTVAMVFGLCSCSEKVEGDALEKYLEIIDSLDCGTVVVDTDMSSDKSTVVYFRQGEKGVEIITFMESKDSTYTNYFDGENYYSGVETLEKYDVEMDAVTAKRNLIGAPDYAIDPDFYDAERSGIYKTLTGYKIVVVTHDAEDYLTDAPDTTLTLYLNSDMVPTKAVIEDEIFDGMDTYVIKTTLKYKNIGVEPVYFLKFPNGPDIQE